MRWLSVAVIALLGIAPRIIERSSGSACDVTLPNNVMPGSDKTAPKTNGNYGNQQLSVGPFGLRDDGNVIFQPGGSGFVTPNGSLGMKFGWTVNVEGVPKIEGRRLDAPAPPLRYEITPDDHVALPRFMASNLLFSTPGCWEVTATIGTSTIKFVTLVTKIGDGPSWRKDIGGF